ncbi:Crp/Fnr family transcriptional regulator [Staphylococcus agnetis]|uniref:Crp/Fnr family transcriptional regulator n=1 Tax=Staphylococcus agnetis TaxID=985762 RepID=UPI0021CF4087|nr:Crp/Fnr family transcriptional regulator [Staphylococcus agnetis]UXU59715.1 Crp/Fnr family transcriptional regulator [Staphylococcus agnetis]UXU62044.1 Crp/Fnr family transcriptional regulator [Staphylococcus agnetis]
MNTHYKTLDTKDLKVAIQTFAHYIHVSPTQLQIFAEDFILRHYDKNQVIYYDTTEMTHLKFIMHGIVLREAFADNGAHYKWLNRAYHCFPLNKLFRTPSVDESCIALTDCDILSVPLFLIEKLSKHDTEVLSRFYELIILSKDQHIQHNMILNCKNAREKVIHLIRLLCENVGSNHESYYELTHAITIQLLADLIGMSRERVSHIVHSLMIENYIFKDKHTWMICKKLFQT